MWESGDSEKGKMKTKIVTLFLMVCALTAWAADDIADARRIAQEVATKELSVIPAKREPMQRMAAALEALEKHQKADDTALWALISLKPQEKDKTFVGAPLIAARRIGMRPETPTKPEKVRQLAGAIAKGLRTALRTQSS